MARQRQWEAYTSAAEHRYTSTTCSVNNSCHVRVTWICSRSTGASKFRKIFNAVKYKFVTTVTTGQKLRSPLWALQPPAPDKPGPPLTAIQKEWMTAILHLQQSGARGAKNIRPVTGPPAREKCQKKCR